jgi:hypothetical protein
VQIFCQLLPGEKAAAGVGIRGVHTAARHTEGDAGRVRKVGPSPCPTEIARVEHVDLGVDGDVHEAERAAQQGGSGRALVEEMGKVIGLDGAAALTDLAHQRLVATLGFANLPASAAVAKHREEGSSAIADRALGLGARKLHVQAHSRQP